MKMKLVGLMLGIVAVGVAAFAWTSLHGPAALGRPPLAGTVAQFIPQDRPTPAPAVTFGDAEDKPMDLSAFRGKVTLINLWATWCGPCVEELPSLERLKKARDGAGFAVVTISEDREGHKAVDPFLDKKGWTSLTRFVDPTSQAGRTLGLRGLPTTLLLDPGGNVLGRLEGAADWSSPEALRLIDWYIAKAEKKAA